MKNYLFLAASLLLCGCTAGPTLTEPVPPSTWQSETVWSTPDQLTEWWMNFADPTLNILVDLALSDSPQQQIALARIEEARGLKRSARSLLFPQLDAAGEIGRGRDGFKVTDTFYEAGFDASYEIDLFGRNRSTARAADAQLRALEADQRNVEITLVAEVTRVYIEYRAAQKQFAIAGNNLNAQQKTLELIQQQRELGETPQLDVERAANLVNTTKASMPEFQRQADNARLRLAVLTGRLPDALPEQLQNPTPLPKTDLQPLLIAPLEVLKNRPDIQVAQATLQANTALAQAEVADLYPTINLAAFFGLAENTQFSHTTIWSALIGGAVNLIDFGRIEGRIDAARAREMQAYQQYRQTVLQAVSEVETALLDHALISEQRSTLQMAFNNAHAALDLSETLYREGEVSFLDVLDAQRTVNDTDAALVAAETGQAQSLVRLYKSLGVY